MAEKKLFNIKKVKLPKVSSPRKLVSFKIQKVKFPLLKPLKLPKMEKVKKPSIPKKLWT